MQSIVTDKAAPPNGHYSQAMLAGSLLFVSTQIPTRPLGDESPKAIDWQVTSVLTSIMEIVKAGGGTLASIARVTLYVKNMADWDQINEIYAHFMGAHKPARGVVAVADLKGGWLVAADAIAVIEKV